MPPHRRRLALAATLLLAATLPLAAQEAGTGRIAGVVYDSLHARPLAGATISVVQRTTGAAQFLTAVTDASGRYRVDSVAAGTFLVGVTTPFLDSLEVELPQRTVTIAGGGHADVDFATPSRATLAGGACPGVAMARGRGAILGQVTDADTDAPLPRATVALSWSDVGLDVQAMRPVTQERSAAVVTDSLGRFRICGVPTGTYVLLQVQHAGRAGTALRTAVAEEAGVAVQNLSLAPTSARLLATDTLAAAAADSAAPLLTGTATLTGVVRDEAGRPMPGAQLRVLDAAAGVARSDSAGRFTLGGLPAGTQMLEARRLGYLVGQQPVELRSGRTVSRDVRLARIVTLDSMRIVAQRSQYDEFSRRAARTTATGDIFTAERVEKMHVAETADLIRRVPGFRVIGEDLDVKILSSRGLASLKMDCEANVVIDGQQHQAINLVPPQNIGAMEVYRGASGAPLQYDSACGTIVIWTKR